MHTHCIHIWAWALGRRTQPTPRAGPDRHPPFAFPQLEDADVILLERVLVHKLEKC
jgi:hypothetical protein